MPQELVAIAPSQPVLRDYEERKPSENEILVRAQFSAAKHGTESFLYHGNAPAGDKRYDPDWHMFVDRDQPRAGFPVTLGNMFVGAVEEVGSQVAGLRPGDRVYGWGGSRDSYTLPASRVRLAPPELTPADIVCLDPAEFAYGAVRDGNVRVGDNVAVFGLGAIGLMAVQCCKIAGARCVWAIDPIAPRRDIAAQLGADLVYDPRETDVALEIHKLTGGAGLDVAIEYSGSSAGLHEAVRSVGYMGTVAVGAWAKPSSSALRLGEEFHMNRTRIISTRACSIPVEDAPRWTYERIQASVLQLFVERRLRGDPIVQPVVPFSQAADAYAAIEREPERYIKLGFTHP